MTIFYTAKAQTFCHTPNHSSNQFLNEMMRSSALSDSSYCVKIYMHVIRTSNGTGGQTTSAVNQAFQILNDDYNPHDISYNWDGVIDYIDNDSYYNSPGVNIYNVNNHTDGIDIYLYHDGAPAGGRANGVGESSEFYLSGSFWNSPYSPLVTSHVISHEMGHVLFLWHTFHGTAEGGTEP